MVLGPHPFRWCPVKGPSVSTDTAARDALPGRTSLDPTNPGPLAPCVILLDVSSSMTSVMSELNEAARELVEDLRNHELAAHRADVAILTYGSHVDVVTPMTIARDLSISSMAANGSTAMGQAIHQAIDTIEARQDEYRTQGIKANVPMVFNSTTANGGTAASGNSHPSSSRTDE